MKILLVEDEPKIASFVKKGFEQEGYDVDIAYDGLMGKKMVFNNYYDIVILDINLPLLNGYELCKLIREENSKIPIILLTALDSVDDKVMGFDLGADDYLVKPFEFRELLARVRALSKRVSDSSNKGKILKIADLELNHDTKLVTRNGDAIELTTREYSLLEYFMINKGKVVSRIDIAEKVWELNFDTSTNVIDVYINYLRKKIDKNYPTKLIHTVVGMGYILRE
jgi:two-component system, OmpR family, copper resistance phosphate regulon response regulator CusR